MPWACDPPQLATKINDPLRLKVNFSTLLNFDTLPFYEFRPHHDLPELSIEKRAISSALMALELYIHLPPPDKLLRIQIQGPLESIQKLLPNGSWHLIGPFPQLGRLKLASLTHQKLYRREGDEAAPAVRDDAATNRTVKEWAWLASTHQDLAAA